LVNELVSLVQLQVLQKRLRDVFNLRPVTIQRHQNERAGKPFDLLSLKPAQPRKHLLEHTLNLLVFAEQSATDQKGHQGLRLRVLAPGSQFCELLSELEAFLILGQLEAGADLAEEGVGGFGPQLETEAEPGVAVHEAAFLVEGDCDIVRALVVLRVNFDALEVVVEWSCHYFRFRVLSRL